MIRATKIMLGDWVLCWGKYVRIKAIRSNKYLDGDDVFESIDAKGVICTSDTVEPIPLTPEILERNGFGKLITYGTEKWIYGDIRMNIYSSNGCWRFCADTKRNENSVVYIHFVHELQHALRLCGIEKEIEL